MWVGSHVRGRYLLIEIHFRNVILYIKKLYTSWTRKEYKKLRVLDALTKVLGDYPVLGVKLFVTQSSRVNSRVGRGSRMSILSICNLFTSVSMYKLSCLTSLSFFLLVPTLPLLSPLIKTGLPTDLTQSFSERTFFEF